MELTAVKFEEGNDSLQSMLRTLMSRLEGLQSTWVGRGGQSFTEVKQRWAEDQAKMSLALAQTAEAIRTSGASYDATDTEASSRMAAVNPGIQLPL
jgi:WXG100 family type VII secretion target